ncbi:carboxylesterase type B [Nocardia tenerifensis]|uniref:Carboxylesterase type B n=1 Tax=Nocardia tenerifensis TaxID=228006 RepID=A0A318K1R1_9NOCA|nr:carboxylesterase family protein [Nocardia tenerifensis]PXX54603.1 carboxylesterase type B [Nocardia tenerifensis]
MDTVVVETSLGRIRGRVDRGVRAFLGVPYAASTAGAARFRPPRPHAAWAGVRDALAFGPACPQPPLREAFGARPETFAMLPLFGIPTSVENQGEHCLVLNIWAMAGPNVQAPVLVWLHGGTDFGAADWPRFDGSSLAGQGDLVVVTVNYRLGVFGCLDLSWTGSPEYAHSGHVGILDLSCALQWLRHNVSAFGGDPGNITVVGGSRGASRLATLLLTTAPRPPFQRAVMASPPPPRRACRHSPEDAARAVLRRLGVSARRPHAIAGTSVRRLLDAQAMVAAELGYRFQPVLDGVPVERRAYAEVAAGIAPGIPLLIGSTLNETSRTLGADEADWAAMNDAELAARCSRIARRDVAALVEEHRRARPHDSARKIAVAVTTDAMYRFPALALASARSAAATAPVYAYVFCGGTGSHSEDVLYFFANLRCAALTSTSRASATLAEQASSAWTSFCHRGHPVVPSVRAWPAYDDRTRNTLLFGNPTRVVANPFAARRALWEQTG